MHLHPFQLIIASLISGLFLMVAPAAMSQSSESISLIIPQVGSVKVFFDAAKSGVPGGKLGGGTR
jgi:ascorbate-specific PTS system EIIC-type component UlaA